MFYLRCVLLDVDIDLISHKSKIIIISVIKMNLSSLPYHHSNVQLPSRKKSSRCEVRIADNLFIFFYFLWRRRKPRNFKLTRLIRLSRISVKLLFVLFATKKCLKVTDQWNCLRASPDINPIDYFFFYINIEIEKTMGINRNCWKSYYFFKKENISQNQ